MAAKSMLGGLQSKATTIVAIFAHFSKGKRIVLIPLLILILLSGLLLIAAGGLSYVAPFVYAIV